MERAVLAGHVVGQRREVVVGTGIRRLFVDRPRVDRAGSWQVGPPGTRRRWPGMRGRRREVGCWRQVIRGARPARCVPIGRRRRRITLRHLLSGRPADGRRRQRRRRWHPVRWHRSVRRGRDRRLAMQRRRGRFARAGVGGRVAIGRTARWLHIGSMGERRATTGRRSERRLGCRWQGRMGRHAGGRRLRRPGVDVVRRPPVGRPIPWNLIRSRLIAVGRPGLRIVCLELVVRPRLVVVGRRWLGDSGSWIRHGRPTPRRLALGGHDVRSPPPMRSTIVAIPWPTPMHIVARP